VVGQPGKTAGSIGSFPDPEAQERGEACSAAPGSWGGIGEERAAPSVEMVIPSESRGDFAGHPVNKPPATIMANPALHAPPAVTCGLIAVFNA
jgi:hypothetical protein